MSVKIRMTRTGANKDIAYRVVAADSRSPRDGKNLEVVGWYDPKKKGVNFSLKMERIEYWTSKGAQVSDTVKSLLRKSRATAKISA
jgi:small subunit ribosomal protein S16